MRRIAVAVVVLGLMLAPTSLKAQIDIGAQGSWGDDVDFGLGGRVVVGLPIEQFPLELIGSFDYFFPDIDNFDYWEINANAAYVIPVPTPTVAPYAGAGINIARASVDVGTVPGVGDFSASDTEVGLNLLGGVKFPLQSVTPYGELRIELGGGEQFVITGGVSFNVGPGFSS